MQQIPFIIRAKSPLAIGRQKRDSSISEVEIYIPGTVLRGAIAGQMIRQAQAAGQDFANDPDSDFKCLFIDNQAIFQNAYPALTEDLQLHPEVRVMPVTALSAKNKSGFKSKGKSGVFDTLIDRFCAEAYGQIYDPNDPTDGDRVDGFKGFYSVVKSSDQDQYFSHAASSRLLTKVGINRRRATSEDKVLYSLQVLNETKQKGDRVEEMAFAGSIWVDNILAEPFRNYLEQQGRSIRIGGGISRGLGKIEIQLMSSEAESSKSTVYQRIDDFNKKLKQRWDRWKFFGSPLQNLLDDRCFFTLDLQSDAILTESWLRTMVISEAMLQQAVNLTTGNLQLHASYSSYGYRAGWNTAWGLHKDMQLTTDRGSVFLFSVDESDRLVWQAALADLEIRGIGHLTAEGFGQIKVCDEFHNVLREEAV
ncbi:MAG: CRISPR-associated RAMP protein Csx10 [Elainella sp. Prado103]|nr:CRISPR-associated RAMP protein Csx10 [Elainella sp. Prado103]